MKAILKQKLAELGITVGPNYTNASEAYAWPLIWGISLTKGHDILYIEHTPRSSGGDGRFYIKEAQYDEPDPLMSFKTQREAVAGCIRVWYGLSDPNHGHLR